MYRVQYSLHFPASPGGPGMYVSHIREDPVQIQTEANYIYCDSSSHRSMSVNFLMKTEPKIVSPRLFRTTQPVSLN